MSTMEKRLTVHARDDPSTGWRAVVSDGQVQVECCGQYVLLFQLVNAIVRVSRREWPGAKFTVESCVVDEEDDSGVLIELLQHEFTNK